MNLLDFFKDLPNMTVRQAAEMYPRFQRTLSDLTAPLEGLVNKYGEGDLKIEDSGPLLQDLGAAIEVLRKKI